MCRRCSLAIGREKAAKMTDRFDFFFLVLVAFKCNFDLGDRHVDFSGPGPRSCASIINLFTSVN